MPPTSIRGSAYFGCSELQGKRMSMIKVEIHQSVARVILDRPDVHNALNDELLGSLREAFLDLGGRPDVRAIILAGNGKSFCAGADLNWMSRVASYSYEE